jgi:hypothetical protein
MTRRSLPLFLLAFLLPALAVAADFPRDEQQIWVTAASHGWNDFNIDNGAQLTDDKGYSVGIGWETQLEGDSYIGFWRPRASAYMGRSDYTEKTASGDIVSKSSLSGWSVGMDYLFRIPLGQSFTLEPVVGLALRMDRRTVGAGSVGSDADNTLVRRGRYREERRGFMGRLGLRAVVAELGGAGDERLLEPYEARHLFVEGGALVPVYMEYQGGLNGRRMVTKYYPGYYFEAGGRIGRWQPSVWYEGIRYDYSGAKQAQSDVVGVRLGWFF